MVSVDPQLPMYVPGERLTLRCSAPQGLAVSSYQFYNRGERVFSESDGPAGGPWLVLTAALEKAGAYSCEYRAVKHGKPIYSSHSQPVWVPVMDRPLAPSISATAGGPWNDSVTVMCLLHGRYMLPAFQIFKNGHLVLSESTPESTHGAQLQLPTSDPRSAGSYTCSYQIDVSGRKVESGLSSPLSIHLPAPPGAPTLFLHPLEPVYFSGETVALLCLDPPGAHRAVGFQFSRDGGKTFLPGSNNTLALRLAGPGDSGSYTCAYWIQPSRWGVRSRESQPVSILVTEPPPAPALALQPPRPVYLRGEQVALRCTAPKAGGERRYRFFKQGEGQNPDVLPPATQGGSRLELDTRHGTGRTYTCKYWSLRVGRWIPSGRSAPASVALTDSPPPPVLSVDPPTGAVKEGPPLLLTCTAPKDSSQLRFHFYKDGAELSPGDLGSELSPTDPGTGSRGVSILHIPQASPHVTGEFACGYEENVDGSLAPMDAPGGRMRRGRGAALLAASHLPLPEEEERPLYVNRPFGADIGE
ncbi:alpha-1B-glycoprotein-like [Pelodiscus sinensis]|uniref:alpha-1B-glycoprotein-like n=1 Tax=Pelodiscus sinensis TaxID=13735 RepID=UPI003F6C3DB3